MTHAEEGRRSSVLVTVIVLVFSFGSVRDDNGLTHFTLLRLCLACVGTPHDYAGGQSPVVRAAHSETWLAARHFVLPLFIHDKPDDEPIASLPGCSRLSFAGLLKEVEGYVRDCNCSLGTCGNGVTLKSDPLLTHTHTHSRLHAHTRMHSFSHHPKFSLTFTHTHTCSQSLEGIRDPQSYPIRQLVDPLTRLCPSVCIALTHPDWCSAIEDGIGMIEVFPAVPDSDKTVECEEAFNDAGIVPRAIRLLKEKWPTLVIVTDVALDPYNSLGHDGIVTPAGVIDNDSTLEVLAKQAVCHAQAGADIIAPSDMMDGRVRVIRTALDAAGFSHVSILSYTAKYASGFYGPFREALDSAPKVDAASTVPTHKKSYQMDPGNKREALREAALDEAEGADIMMVKPAGPYLDVIAALRSASTLPIAAYHVSGEYAMLKAACLNGWLDERKVVLETLVGIRRAGADIIFTYYARQASRWLAEDAAAMVGGRQFSDH
jgi:porphobilinogen synthase